MPDFSFRLLPDFIEKYKDVEPPFGFRDAGGNSLGELTFLRTYSNLNSDGTKERWLDTCVRVTNGTYSIQKSHAKNNKLEWNDQKGQSSAKEFFDRMFNLKWTPPGRGLEKMGSKQVMDGNSASLQNCFSYDTEYITDRGIRSLGDTVGTIQNVLTENGWEKAEIRAFGEQNLQEISFTPFNSAKSNHMVTFKATPNHRWVLKDGSVTTELKDGDVVQAMAAKNAGHDSEGFLHGLMFADGSLNYVYKNGDFSHMMRLCGEKEKYKDLFDKYSYQPNCGGDPVVYHRSSKNLKALPASESPEYIASFIRGWMEFDGHQEGPSYVIDTANQEAADWLKDHAVYAGFTVRGISIVTSPTNYGERGSALFRVRISDKNFLWKVNAIVSLPEKEEVFCAVVPGTEKFTLAGGVYTGNCAVISTGDIDRHDPGAVFQWAMLALMYGVGVGADMLGAKKNIEIRERVGDVELFVVPDSREGWAESLRLLINSYLRHNAPVSFDYSLIRPKGAPLKTFGGLASGPEPLVMLHDRLEVIFEKRVGRVLDSETIVDIFNMIGACVIAGSTRRSAEIMLGDYDDTAFLDLKNSSVYPERNSYDPENPGWAWASNNSINVPVGADYEKYLDLIVNNGEPGFVWLDVAKSRGRMMDAPDDKDRRVVGFNPCCLSPDTTIMTSDGPRKISDIDSDFVAVVDGVEYNATKPWVSGVGDVYKLKTKEGFELELTPEHQILTDSGEWKQAQELTVGEKIRLNSHQSYSWGDINNFGDGYVIGQFIGDGNFSSHGISIRNRGSVKAGDRTYRAECKLWDIAGDDFEAAEFMEKIASQYATRSDWAGWSNVSDRPYQMMTITNLARQYQLNPNDKHNITHLERESSEFYRGFLCGLFDADGHVEGYEESDSFKGLSIRLGQSNYAMLQGVQRMLLRLGINSKIYNSRPAGQSWLPDGKGGNKYYNTKQSYRLVISADSALKFANEIGFMHRTKSQKLENALSWRKQVYRKPFVATVESFEFVRRGEVWDAEVEVVHAFDANGIYAHNSEQPLESQEMCTLVTVHLQNAESKEDFLRTLKFAFLYAKTVTLVPTPWTKTNSVMQRNRRIGLSLTGITDVIDERGLPEILEWMDAGYQEVRRLDKIYSEWLCVRESNRVTTIKPEGTVSLLSGASPGIHWGPGGKYYMRAIRFGGSDKMIPLFRAAGYKVEKDLVSHDTYVVYFPVKSNAHRSEREVSVFEKIGLAAKAQHYWSDNGVSVTVSFDKETEKHLLVPALRLHEGSLKAVSFLPMSNEAYPQQPYTQITEEEYNSYLGSIKKIDFSAIYDGVDNLEAIGDRYCSNDTCSI